MKKTVKLLISVMLILSLVMGMAAISAYADEDVEEMRKSSVYVYSSFKFSAANNSSIAFTYYATGTGFAVGKVGEPVQYIATAKHIVVQDSGIYNVYYNSAGNIVDFDEGVEGTKVPRWSEDGGYAVYTDYFNVTTNEVRAIYSESSADYTTMSIIAVATSDVAICKLASDPTNKVKAYPLKLYNDTKVGDEIYAVGYPGVSMALNDEGKYDYSDSTVTSGIISKKQLTKGLSGGNEQFNTYQISAEVSSGNSGGPVITAEGAIIGVTSLIYANSAQVAAARYAVCIDELVKLLDANHIPYTLWNEAPLPVGDFFPVGDFTDDVANTVPVTNNDNSNNGNNNIGMIIAICAALLVVAAVVSVVMTKKRSNAGYTAGVGTNVQMPVTAPVSPETGKKCYIIGVTGVFKGRKFEVKDKVVIGRDSSKCNVAYPVDQPGISGIHCQIIREGASVKLSDCNSTYGTFTYDGKKLEANVVAMLQNGSKFYLGNKDNTFEVQFN